jgi:hypothetical protein
MNISAVLEDLEVEGFFASSKASDEQSSTVFHERVRVVCADEVNDLLLPIQGKDFLAGFETNGSKNYWLVFLNFRYVEVENHSSTFQRTELNLSSLIQIHLTHCLIRARFFNQPQELTGYVISANKHFLDLVTPSGMCLKVSIQSISSLAVEKLSIKHKV